MDNVHIPRVRDVSVNPLCSFIMLEGSRHRPIHGTSRHSPKNPNRKIQVSIFDLASTSAFKRSERSFNFTEYPYNTAGGQ